MVIFFLPLNYLKFDIIITYFILIIDKDDYFN
jgi:hypothetical protein